MLILEGTRAGRFDLVSAGHRLLFAALPLRDPQSRQALETFLEAAHGCRLSSADRDSVLLRLLAVLEPHSGGRLPSLVDRYLSLRHEIPDGVRRFQRCMEDVIRYRGIGNPWVQAAIASIHERYADADLRQADVAELVGVTPPALCTAFKLQTGMTFVEYLREVRLDRAAAMLAGSNRSVKEVWAGAGYNDAANFDHDFKQRFGMPPKEYRARVLRPAPAAPTLPVASVGPTDQPADSHRVLIVDDDPGTRDALGTQLRLAGYAIDVAASGRDALERDVTVKADVVLLDFHLPDMDGFACLRALRQRRPGVHPVVVVFTADWDVEDRADEAHALGASIVSKLCDAAEVERVVRSFCAMRPRHVPAWTRDASGRCIAGIRKICPTIADSDRTIAVP